MSTRSALRAQLVPLKNPRTDALERIAAEHPPNSALIDSLLALMDDNAPQVRSGAVWMLRRCQRQGTPFTAAQSGRVIDALLNSTRWTHTLNLLQMLNSLTIAPGKNASLRAFLEARTRDRNDFVRAWAYNGLHLLSRSMPRHRARIDALLPKALATETPAVRARIRQLRASGSIKELPHAR